MSHSPGGAEVERQKLDTVNLEIWTPVLYWRFWRINKKVNVSREYYFKWANNNLGLQRGDRQKSKSEVDPRTGRIKIFVMIIDT